MPIKMPSCPEYGVPRAFAQFAPTIQWLADVEARVNP